MGHRQKFRRCPSSIKEAECQQGPDVESGTKPARTHNCVTAAGFVPNPNLLVCLEEEEIRALNEYKEDLFATVRLDTHFMHLIGNTAEKAYGNRTNRNCVVWSSGMACPMTHLPVPDLPSTYDGEYKKGDIIGCHCPMCTFETPELYVAHFQLYHIIPRS